MVYRFYKHKLLLDENMPLHLEFPRLNGLFDVKHVRDDLGSGGIADPDVYALAVKLQRLIVTFNARDFKLVATRSQVTGIIAVSATLPSQQIDTKLTALLVRSSAKALLGKLTTITGETSVSHAA
jgi:predicted nuclease of predicted toxin-antitoxin system